MDKFIIVKDNLKLFNHLSVAYAHTKKEAREKREAMLTDDPDCVMFIYKLVQD